MNIERVNEIMESKGVIGVSYKGDPVWLERIYNEDHIIKVKNIKTHEELDVDIKDLNED